MIDVQLSPQEQLARIERTLVEAYGLLGLMQSDGVIGQHWHSFVEQVRTNLGVAVLDVMALQKKGEMMQHEEQCVS